MPYPTIEFCSLDACYVTIKGRVFYIDMSLDEPIVETWIDLKSTPKLDESNPETLMGGGGPND